MKRLTLTFLGLIFAIVCIAQSKAEKAVVAAAEKLRLAMISGNAVELDNLVVDQLTYGHSGGQVDDKKEFLHKLTGGGSDFVSITITEQTVNVINKTGVVRHILKAETNDNNKPGTVHLKVLLIFVKDNGKWKLAARQAVKMV